MFEEIDSWTENLTESDLKLVRIYPWEYYSEEKCGRYRELKYEKKNYIILGFRKEREMLLQHNVIHSEGCAVDGTESKKS